MTERTRLARLALNPVFIAAVNFSGVFAGWLGAHFEHQIADSFFPVLLTGTSFSAGATAFWVVALMFAVGMMLALDQQSKESGRTAERIEVGTQSLGLHVGQLEGQSRQLLDAAVDIGRQVQRLHTLPPPGFLENFAKGGSELVAAAFQATDGPIEERQQLVRVLLNYLLTLASRFDNDGEKCRYGANLMVFRDVTTLDAAALQEIHGRLHFCEDSVDVARLAGVLDLVPELSVSTDSRVNPDLQLKPIALPISANGAAPLPGAPQAFATKLPVVFEAESDLTAVDNDRNFSKFVMQKMHDFFRARKGVIESFMCFPVYSPRRPHGIPIAVLNLHRNRPNNLAGEKLPLLDSLFAPLCMALGAVLDSLEHGGTKLDNATKEHHE